MVRVYGEEGVKMIPMIRGGEDVGKCNGVQKGKLTICSLFSCQIHSIFEWKISVTENLRVRSSRIGD